MIGRYTIKNFQNFRNLKEHAILFRNIIKIIFHKIRTFLRN